MRRESARLGAGQRRAEMHGLSVGIHGRAAQAPLSQLRQGVLRPLQQQQRSTASLRAHETRESVQQVFPVSSDAFYGLPSHVHQLNIPGSWLVNRITFH